MQKVLCALYVFIYLFLLTLCGCQSSSVQKQKSLVTDFSADFCAEYNDMKLKGSVVSDRHGLIGINITSPDTIAGLSVNYKGGETELKRDSLICSADEAYLPSGSFPNLIKNILKGISDGRAELSAQNGESSFYNLKTDNGTCIITADKSGNIAEAKIENEKFYIQFSEPKFLENKDSTK